MTLYWHQLHTCGVRVYGPAPATLFPVVPWPCVCAEMYTNLNDYWMRRARRPLDFWLDEQVEFAVLTICRILYTLQYGAIASKLDAGAWALSVLPQEWHALIAEALRIRRDLSVPGYFVTRWQRARATRAFIVSMNAVVQADQSHVSGLG
jgi:hypothetical protein